jgi:NADH-quinone oxidoreductase subunit G
MTLAPDRPAQPEQLELVTVTVDGFELRVPKGTLIIRAAEQLGVQIPRFCDHPLLDPIGACRQCLVEVEGQRKPVASCTATVADGMVVKTQLTSPVADKAQQGTMEMLLINHPLDCPVCDKGGECPLQNQAMSNGRADSRFRDVKRTYPKPIAISAQVLLDRERCVLCARCTRFSEQVAGDPFIELFERGALEQVAIYEDEPFESYFSGNTVQICPVGALTSAAYRFRARPFDLMSTPGVCEHCASGCAQRTDWRRSKVMRRLAADDPAVNEEWNCDKGRFAFGYLGQADRLTVPLVRDEKSGELVEASWTEALERAAEGLREARDSGGVGVLPGGRLTLEDAYAYAKFARVALETNDIDGRARAVGSASEELDFLAARVAGLGPDTGAVTYGELEAAPAVLLVGFEPEEESPIVFLRLRKAARKRGQRLFAVAPWLTNGVRKAFGTLLATVPGEEPRLLRALAVPGRAGDAPVVTLPAEAPPQTVSGAMAAGRPGPVAAPPAEAVRAAADALRVHGAVILVGERAAEVPGLLTAAAGLATATGARLAWVPRRAGERPVIDAGALPTLLPGGRRVTDDGGRGEVEAAWGGLLPTTPGRDVTAIVAAAAAGELSALVIGGVDVDDLPDPAAARAALERVGFVVSLEIRRSSVTAHADVVLPVAPVVEKAGTFVDWEGRARPFEATLRGTGALPDSRVLHVLADEMDVELGLPSVDAVRAELLRVGTTRRPRSADPSVAVPEPVTVWPSLPAGQAVLATWRQLLDRGSMQDGEPHLAGTAREPVAAVSPGTAAELGLVDGAKLTVRTGRGSVTLPARLVPMPDGVVWLPANSPGSAVRPTLGVGAGAVVEISGGAA